ncbi:nuclear envelope integral membrane protein 1a-like isoform X1 [Argonauta hians]
MDIISLLLIISLITSSSFGFLSQHQQLCGNIADCTVIDVTKPFISIRNDNEITEKTWLFCYPGEKKNIYKLWLSPMLKLNINGDYSLSFGVNAMETEASTSLFSLNMIRSKLFQSKEISLHPFNSTCVSISTSSEFSVQLRIKGIDIWLLIVFLLGILLFINADQWSQNSTFHYLMGTVFGIIFSLLIILFLVSRLISKKFVTAAFFVSGMSGLLFTFHWFYQNIFVLTKEYWISLLVYLSTTGVLSFFLTYRFGPVTDDRSKKILCWILQVIGLFLVFNGTQLAEVSTAVIIVILAVHNRPQCLDSFYKRFKYKYFPPKRQFLTEEEYITQGAVETKIALEKLRDYCRSPECAPWAIMNKVSTPKRFTSFILGNSHITDDELLLYNTDMGEIERISDDSRLSQDSDIELNWEDSF